MSFQFHKGTIRTPFFSRMDGVRGIFQFHKGTIRTFKMVNRHYCLEYFNSIKVQLEHDFTNAKDEGRRYFNSIKVQLEPHS